MSNEGYTLLYIVKQIFDVYLDFRKVWKEPESIMMSS